MSEKEEYQKTVNEWFNNKEFSFEEKEAIYISFNAILATKNNIAENELGKDMIQSFNNRLKFYTHD